MLAVDHRPKTFTDLVGMSASLVALGAYRAKHGKNPQVVLIYGPSGCGKTTIAGLLIDGVHPLSLEVLNAADHNGVAAMRKLIDKMQDTPMLGDRRVFVLNEAQGLSKEAQSALLDALENVPPHGQWIFTSMEPDRLQKALRDRCFKIEVSPLRSVEDVLRLIEPHGGTREDALGFFQSGVTAPRDILSRLESKIAQPVSGPQMYESVQKFWRGEGISAFFSEAQPDEIIAWYYAAMAYGRKIFLGSRSTPEVAAMLARLAAVPVTSDTVVRAVAICLAATQRRN